MRSIHDGFTDNTYHYRMAANTDPRGLRIERVLNASRDAVWRAWTDPNEIARWWGPRGVTTPTCTWDARPGGDIYLVMLAGKELGHMSGQEWPMSGTIEEVTEPERLVFLASAVVNGLPILDTRDVVTLKDQGDKTNLVLEVHVLRAAPEAEGPLAGMETGWTQSIDKLEEYVSSNNNTHHV